MSGVKSVREVLWSRPGSYVPHYALQTEGGRVGLTMCLLCGCAILMCDDRDPFALHEEWHRTVAGAGR